MSEERSDYEQRDERGRLFSVVAEGRRFYYLDTLVDEVERLRAENERMAATLSDVFCEITGGRLSYPTYDARTIITEVNDRIDEHVREGIAESESEVRSLRGVVQAVRVLHVHDGSDLIGDETCCRECGVGLPCPTLRALAGGQR